MSLMRITAKTPVNDLVTSGILVSEKKTTAQELTVRLQTKKISTSADIFKPDWCVLRTNWRKSMHTGILSFGQMRPN